LTAAQCAAGYEVGETVFIGANSFGTGGQAKIIDSKIVHPDYAENRANDVMLVKLTTTSSIRPVTLNRIKLFSWNNRRVKTIGFNITEGGNTPSALMQVRMRIGSRKECAVANPTFRAELYQMCTAVSKGGAICPNEGGPLFVGSLRPVQHGIISTGYGCIDTETPGIYTHVSFFYDWIWENVCSGTVAKKAIANLETD